MSETRQKVSRRSREANFYPPCRHVFANEYAPLTPANHNRMGPITLPAALNPLLDLLRPALSRLELSFAPAVSIARLRRHRFSWRNEGHYLFLFTLACINFTYIPSKLLCLLLASAYTLALLLPITSQFVLPATPIFSWLLCFFSSRYIPTSIRPHIWVTVLPTLESVLYGANISDILTRYTHPALDILAWLPYGLLHFVVPFVIAAVLFVFAPCVTSTITAKRSSQDTQSRRGQTLGQDLWLHELDRRLDPNRLSLLTTLCVSTTLRK